MRIAVSRRHWFVVGAERNRCLLMALCVTALHGTIMALLEYQRTSIGTGAEFVGRE